MKKEELKNNNKRYLEKGAMETERTLASKTAVVSSKNSPTLLVLYEKQK